MKSAWVPGIVLLACIGTLVVTVDLRAQQTPYPGPHAVLGIVEAEDYDNGGSGVAYHDNTDGNSGGAYRSDDVDIAVGGTGFKVTAMEAGEWLEYTVTAAAPAPYRMILTYLSPGGHLTSKWCAKLHLEVNGLPGSPFTPLSNTSPTAAGTATTPLFRLSAGDNVIRIAVDAVADGIELDYFRIYPEPVPYDDWAAYWRFDNDPYRGTDTSMPQPVVGPCSDESGNGNTAAIGGSPAHLISSAVIFPASGSGRVPYTGIEGNKVTLELIASEGDYLKVADSPSLDMGASKSFTIQAFVQVYNNATAPRCWLVHKKRGVEGGDSDGDANTDYGFLVGGGDLATGPATWTNLQTPPTGRELVLVFGSPDGLQTAVSTLALPEAGPGVDPPWVHVVASYDANAHRVVFQLDQYTDVVSNVVPSSVPNDGPLWIGAHIDESGAVDQYLDANIDELLITTTPKKPGYPEPALKWFWQNEGRNPSDVINADGRQVFDFYHVKWSDQPYSLAPNWYEREIPGEPGNMAWYVDKPERFARFFWDQTYYDTSVTPTNFSIAPYERSDGATFVMRFWIESWTTTSATSTMKFIRYGHRLAGAGAGVYNKPHFEVGYIGGVLGRPVGLRNDDTKAFTPAATDRFHTLRHVAKVNPATGNLDVRVYWDGQLIESYVRSTGDSAPDQPTFAPNDNNRRHTCKVWFDYVRCSVAGAFYPGDFDMDGDCDVNDFAHFQACFNGPAALPAAAGCDDADFDSDADVDVGDFAAFQVCFNGANNPPACR